MTVTETLPPTAETGKRKESRADRALALYVEHAEAIALSFRRGTYEVPSCSGDTTYAVQIVPQPLCSCPDFRRGGADCKHILTVRVVRKHTSPCAGCGRRFRRRELFEVPEAHEVFFEGDRLCGGCARKHGIK
ncbi:MAG: SWIM zinc finger domain-containing protein [Actinomycetota bacterium]|nr:SWIM zinc finger domain-containing protein [Actinomycetota bacterium]